MRLIDADALLEHLNKNWYGDVTEEIKRAPTINAMDIAVIGYEAAKKAERPIGEWIKWNFKTFGADMRSNKKETTFDDYLNEQLKDPEFRKEYEKLCDENKQKGDVE